MKVTNFIKEVTARLKGDEAGVIAAKVERKALSAINGQLAALKAKLVDDETAVEDAEEALETVDIYRAEGFSGPIYLMPVGGVESVYTLNNRRVAELAMKKGLRYSDRLQVPLFKNEWGT